MFKLGIALVVAALVSVGADPPARWASPTPSTGQQGIEDAIRAVHQQMLHAAGDLDVDALYAYVLDTETPPIVENTRLAPNRSAAIQNTQEGLQGLRSLTYAYTREHITVLSPTAALWVGEGRASATLEDGRVITAPFTESIVFIQRDGQWRILHAHRSTQS